MTTSILNDCLQIREQPSEKMLDYLHSVNINIFDALFEKKDNLDFEPKMKVLYILTAYSEESPLVILRQDSKTEQENICEYLQIPEIYRHGLINLVDKDLRMAVTSYVDQFSSKLFRWLTFAKIQYRDFEIIVTNRDFKTQDGDTNIYHYDIKEHGKCIAEMERLAKKIQEVENQLRRERTISDGLDKMRDWKEKKGAKTQTVGISVENSTLIE